MGEKVTFIDFADIKNKTVLLRVDFNVSLNPDYTIADDLRIKQSLPTINYLLENKNKIIIVSHLDRPKGRDLKYSLAPVVKKLQEYLSSYEIKLVDDFINTDASVFKSQTENEILVLENIRFYKEEQENGQEFAKKLASLAQVFVNDAFGVSHRVDASVVGVASYLPSFGGLLLKKEIEMISKITENPQKPVVAIIGGAKISTKINLIGKLIEIADYLLIGGGLANTFFCVKGFEIGTSYCELSEVAHARKILAMAEDKNTALILPTDVVIGVSDNEENAGKVVNVDKIPEGGCILDIGPQTQAEFGAAIAKAKTIIWNGPIGYIENPIFRRGTDFVYYAVTQNSDAVSIVGGGDTLAAISKKEYLDKITHVSTGGGAMLEFIENGTLPGIEALKQKVASPV